MTKKTTKNSKKNISYELFGKEWEEALMRMTKPVLIDLYRKACLEVENKNGIMPLSEYTRVLSIHYSRMAELHKKQAWFHGRMAIYFALFSGGLIFLSVIAR